MLQVATVQKLSLFLSVSIYLLETINNLALIWLSLISNGNPSLNNLAIKNQFIKPRRGFEKLKLLNQPTSRDEGGSKS